MAETSCCDNRRVMGLEWSLPRLSFPLPNTHSLVQPGKAFGDSRLSFNLGLYGSSELPMTCLPPGPGTIPDPGGLVVVGEGRRVFTASHQRVAVTAVLCVG